MGCFLLYKWGSDIHHNVLVNGNFCYLLSGQYIFCVSGDDVGHIYKYSGSKPQNPILLLTPMCQDTPQQILDYHVDLCNFNEFFARAIYQKGGFEVITTIKLPVSKVYHIKTLSRDV